jgi:DNA-binding PadR family transcriptional regulator
MLLALVDGERHGYGIMQETARLSAGRVNLGPGTLYRSIRRLLDDGLIEESNERPVPELDDERRHYYQLTPFGLRVARAEAQRLAALVQTAPVKHLLPQPGVVTLEGGV